MRMEIKQEIGFQLRKEKNIEGKCQNDSLTSEISAGIKRSVFNSALISA